VVQIVLSLFREKAQKKGVRLASRIAKNLPALFTDQRAVEQVLANLVDNAVKYCSAGSSVTVSADEEHGEIRLQRAQLPDLAVVDLAQLNCLHGPVGVLGQQKQVEHPYGVALDQSCQLVGDLARQVASPAGNSITR